MADLNLSVGTLIFSGPAAMTKAVDAVKAAGIKEIDTAEGYGNGANESDLGAVGAAAQGLTISTKISGGWAPGKSLVPEVIIKSANASLERLKVDQVDIYYVHAPDPTVEVGSWIPTIDKLYKEGKFRRFGVSNFSASQVREVYDYSKANNYVLPTVYQGNYNAMARKIESDLFPVLRELGICFYAYSPIAGGFLAKSRKALEADTEGGRFSKDDTSFINVLYRKMYLGKKNILEALDKWEELAAEQGVPKAELAYRWVYYHSALDPKLGDNVIVGASKVEQITSTAEGLKKGPLKPEVAKGVDAFWELVKEDAIADNYEAQQKGK